VAQTPEGKVKDKIKVILKRYGVYHVMPIGTGYGNAGVPDFICCVPPRGGFLAIEAKANGGKTTALQDKNIEEILVRGGEAVVIDEHGFATLEELLKQMTGKKQ
jgi:hypothetical protein